MTTTDTADDDTLTVTLHFSNGELVDTCFIRADALVSELAERARNIVGHCTLVLGGQTLHLDSTLASAGLLDGCQVLCILLSECMEFDEDASSIVVIRDRKSRANIVATNSTTWGLAVSPLFRHQNTYAMSFQLGPTAGQEANDTDYFVGILPGNAESSDGKIMSDQLMDLGVPLIASTYSTFAGQVGSTGWQPCGAGKKFAEGDVITVEVSGRFPEVTIRFALNGYWSDSRPMETLVRNITDWEEMRFGVAMYSFDVQRAVEVVPFDEIVAQKMSHER